MIQAAYPDDTDPGALPVPTEPHMKTARPASRAGPSRWILRAGLVAILIVSASLLINARKKTRTVAEVTAQVQATALTRPDGGTLGDWWISAQTLDPVGRLVNFHVEVGPVHYAAQSCAIIVDADGDSITLEMTGVVAIRVDAQPPDTAVNRPLIELERYVLGPIPFPYDIR